MKKGLVKAALHQFFPLIMAVAVFVVVFSNEFGSVENLNAEGYWSVYDLHRYTDWYIWVLMAFYTNLAMRSLRKSPAGEFLCSLPAAKRDIWMSYWGAGTILCGGMYVVVYLLMLLQTLGMGLNAFYMIIGFIGRWTVSVTVFTLVWALAAYFNHVTNIMAAVGILLLGRWLLQGLDHVMFSYWGVRTGRSLYVTVRNWLFVFRNNMDALEWQTKQSPVWSYLYTFRWLIWIAVLLILAGIVWLLLRQGQKWMDDNRLTVKYVFAQSKMPKGTGYVALFLAILMFAFSFDMYALLPERYEEYFMTHEFDSEALFRQEYHLEPDEDAALYENYVESLTVTNENRENVPGLRWQNNDTITNYTMDHCLYRSYSRMVNYPMELDHFFVTLGISLAAGALIVFLYNKYESKWEEVLE